ncbi:MAG: PIN domain-containing protein [Balneolaceae bacterium]
MAKHKVLLDTNICLDAMLIREPFAQTAEQLLFAAETRQVQILVSAISFDTLFYFAKRSYNTQKAYKALQSLRKIVNVAVVNQKSIDLALQSNWKDFEDALQHYSATGNGCDAIITRNIADFSKSTVPLFTAQEFLLKEDFTL